MSKEFQSKHGRWLTLDAEEALKRVLVPRVPRWCETHHLTMTTLLWSAGVIAFSSLAACDLRWLWGASTCIALQYVTDLLDGAVGRERDTGLVLWGYYMDHLLDYLFLCSILIGYSLLLPEGFQTQLLYLLALFGAFMVNSFLAFTVTKEFRISYLGIGPTEIRGVFILVNTALIVFGKTHLGPALPWVLGASAFGLVVTVVRTQRRIWRMDMANKAAAA